MNSISDIAVRTAAFTLAGVATSAMAAALLVSPASAADIPARAGALPPPPIFTQAPPFTWSGFYIGANAGFSFAGERRNAVFVNPPGTGLNDIGGRRGTGGLAGLQAGYNWQSGNLVYGIETDIQTVLNGRHRAGPATLPDGTVATGRASGGWYGTLRPRVGYAFDRTLLYVTGGLAYGGGNHSIATVDGGGNTALLRSNSTRLGWTAGAGAEYAFSRNWSAKLEYQYVNFGTDKMTGAVFTPAGVATGTTINSRHENNFHVIKAGLNYRF